MEQRWLIPQRPNLSIPSIFEARRVLLDALFALAPQEDAIIVVGAQAVYLRTGDADIAIAPFTSDSDLALDPSLLRDDPTIEDALRGANFQLVEDPAGGAKPGSWVTTISIEGREHIVPLDLLVPEALSPGEGRRGARLGPHGKRAARKVRGLEAVVVDNDTMTISALDPLDPRSIDVKVAGSAALLIAKAYKIAERVASGKTNRYADKDGADVLRLMQSTDPAEVATTMTHGLAKTMSFRNRCVKGLTIYVTSLVGGLVPESRWRIEHSAKRCQRTASPSSVLPI